MGYGCGCFPGFCECRDSVAIPTGLVWVWDGQSPQQPGLLDIKVPNSITTIYIHLYSPFSCIHELCNRTSFSSDEFAQLLHDLTATEPRRTMGIRT